MRSVPHLRLAIAGAVMLAACEACSRSPVSPTSPPPTPPARIIVGRVLDVQANRGVPGTSLAWSVVEDSQIASITRVVTDDAGIYVVQVPLADRYFVRINEQASAATVLLPSDGRATDFLLNSGGCPLRYGLILDATTRRPIAGALVHWAFVETISNADGSYRLQLECGRRVGVGSGTTSFFATHASYNSWSRFDARAETLGVFPGESRIDIALTPR